MKYQDYYAVLGVARDVEQDEIQRAYRKLARKHHPDVNKSPGASDKFKEITEAYEVLKDPKKRERYDRLGANWKAGQEFTPPPGWEAHARGAHGARGGDAVHEGEDQDPFEEFDGLGGFSSFFEAFFGRDGARPGGTRERWGRGGFEGARSRLGASIEASITLDLEDAYRGAKKTITLSSPDGSSAPRTLDVTIPPGTTHGSTIRLKGQGAPGHGGAPDGDLLLHVEIAPHARFTVSDHDLSMTLPIAPWEAALGAKVKVILPDGSEALLSVPSGSSSGRKLRMRGMGLRKRGAQRGDLIVELRIAVPESLSEAETRLFEELKRISRFDPRS